MGGRVFYDQSNVPFPHLSPITENMVDIFLDTTHFSQHSSIYNNILALAATGVENDHNGCFERDMFGPHAIKMNGRTYHFLPTAIANSTDPSCGLSYFAFDAQAALLNHGQNVPGVVHGTINEATLSTIHHELSHINYLCQELAQIGRYGNFHDNSPTMVATIHASLNFFEVAQITSDALSGNRCLRITLKGQAGTTSIPLTSSLMEPLSYPIFFNRGEDGWGEEIRKKVGFMEYLSTRLLQPEYLADGSPFLIPSKIDPDELLHVNRFQALARARQVYLVDMVSRAIDFRLKWHTNNQDTIFGGEKQTSYNSNLHVTEEVSEMERTTFLPSSFHGGRRHLKQKASNALAIVFELGNPSLFITLTCNPMWQEIQSQLLPGQTAFDRDDIVCMAFKNRLEDILRNIKSGKYFGPHKLAYIIRVIEYQHRYTYNLHIKIVF